MSSAARLAERDEAITADVASALKKRLRLTPVGETYVRHFAGYLLKVNRMNEGQAATVKRPKCSFSGVLGRTLRQETAAELTRALRDNGRSLDVPVGVMQTPQGVDI